MDSTEILCRFCLKHVNGTYFEALGEPRDILGTLNLKMNLDISEKSVTCIDCIESLRKLFSFKLICVQSEDYLRSFNNAHVNKEIDMQQVYLEINGSNSLDDKICRFCMCEAPVNTSVALSAIIELTLPTKYLLEFFPEVDLSLVRDPVICKMCHNLLQDHLTFTKKCMNVEESIQKYVEAKGTNAEEKIDLRGVKQFMDIVIIKKEIEDENIFKHEIQHDEVVEDASSKVDIKMESYIQIEDSQLDIKSESVEIKPIVNNLESILDVASAESRENYNQHFVIHDFPDLKPYKCWTSNSSVCKGDILVHTNSKIKINKYMNENDEFQTKYRSTTCHSSEESIHKCDAEGCLYKTKYKNCLIKHKLVHKTIPQVKIYKCEFEGCLYQTENKRYLIKHKVVHKDISEAMVYKCGFEGCLYETKCKSYLVKHVLIHRNPSEVTMYKCEAEGCPYESKRKNDVTKHTLNHKDVSEVKMYKCVFEGCSFDTKYKSNLVKHKLIHKDVSEVKMYKCEFQGCSHNTKHRSALIRHKLIHKDVSEVKLYKCEFEGCSYVTRRKSNLMKHKVIHEDVSEVKMYKCEFQGCSHSTKHKSGLIRHKLIHKGV